VQELAQYWEEGFDWRKAEAHINSFANYEMRVNGIEVDTLHYLEICFLNSGT